MTTVKTPSEFNLKVNSSVIIIVVLWLAGSLIITNVLVEGDMMKGILFGWFLFMMGAMFWYSRKSDTTFVCPDCNTPIPETVERSDEPDEPAMHYCKKCDVMWRTGNLPSNKK